MWKTNQIINKIDMKTVFNFSVSLVCSVQLAQAVTLWSSDRAPASQMESDVYYRDQVALGPSGIVTSILD